MTLEQEFKKETGLDAYILNDLRGHIAIDTYVEWLEEKCNIPVVGSSALYNDMPLVYNMCLSYRHDFGLLNATEQEQLVFECKEWLRAYENNK